MTDRVPEINFRVYRISQKMGLRHVKQGFSSFFAQIFGIHLMIFQSRACRRYCKTLKNHQIYQNNWRKMKKSLVQLALKPHFSADSGYSKPDACSSTNSFILASCKNSICFSNSIRSTERLTKSPALKLFL